ncbi:MAG: nickel-binding protein [Ferruginibacter sp.]
MPIYMDRHDVAEMVTADHVAHIHREDLKIQHKFGCRGLTYWFDEKRKTAFCLIEAPDEKAIRMMHKEAHGQIPHRIIEVDAGVVESFLGRIEDPEKGENNEFNIITEPALRTIMALTLKQLSRAQSDSKQYESSLPDYMHAALNSLNIYEGQVVKQTHNGFLVSFKSVSKAIQAALDIKSSFNKIRGKKKVEMTGLRIGLNAGVPVTEKKMFFEDTIKLAERMCMFIESEIIVSSEVKELYNNESVKALREEENILLLTPADEAFLTSLMDYIDTTWSDTVVSVDDFSKSVRCSKSQLYRKMIFLTGKSPNTFILEYRLNEALALLNKQSGNVSEIAFETGFTSPSYFSKCFRKKYGVLPSYYLPAKWG